MAAPDEHDSATEAPQTAVQEEETKTFKDLVSVDDAGFSLYCWRQAHRVRLPYILAGGVQKQLGPSWALPQFPKLGLRLCPEASGCEWWEGCPCLRVPICAFLHFGVAPFVFARRLYTRRPPHTTPPKSWATESNEAGLDSDPVAF